jgi:hypothetical protein
MALASFSGFGSFDITDGSQIRDISSVLTEALILDFEFMGRGQTMGEPATDTTFYWNEEQLNSNVVTLSASVTSTATSLTLTTGHGARTHIGDLLVCTSVNNATEVLQITDISSDTLTVTRAYDSTVATSYAASVTFAVMPAYQEGSDWSADKSLKPLVRSNFTQIVFAGDLLISRSQLQRNMATVALDVDRQLANRAIELKRYWTTTCLYSRNSSSAGSDSVYRTTAGLVDFIQTNGTEYSTSGALSLSVINGRNKAAVDLGKYNTTLLVGTDLVTSIASIDASNRRLVESDKGVGYAVNRILCDQGNELEVVVDGRVKTGDWFVYTKEDVSWRPLAGAGMFTIAATDFVDGVKRRLGSEGGLQVRNSAGFVYGRNAT